MWEVFKSNPNHFPAGSPKGGQFAPKNGGGGGSPETPPKTVKERIKESSARLYDKYHIRVEQDEDKLYADFQKHIAKKAPTDMAADESEMIFSWGYHVPDVDVAKRCEDTEEVMSMLTEHCGYTPSEVRLSIGLSPDHSFGVSFLKGVTDECGIPFVPVRVDPQIAYTRGGKIIAQDDITKEVLHSSLDGTTWGVYSKIAFAQRSYDVYHAVSAKPATLEDDIKHYTDIRYKTTVVHELAHAKTEAKHLNAMKAFALKEMGIDREPTPSDINKLQTFMDKIKRMVSIYATTKSTEGIAEICSYTGNTLYGEKGGLPRLPRALELIAKDMGFLPKKYWGS